MSTFRFFVIEQFVFYCPSEKKLCFVSFLFEKQKHKKVSKYFNIEKDFLKLLIIFFFVFRFRMGTFRFFKTKFSEYSTTNLILSNWLNSMVVRLDISSNFFKNKPLLLFRLNPHRF